MQEVSDLIILLIEKYNIPMFIVGCFIVGAIILFNVENLFLLKGAICQFFSSFSTKAHKGAISNKVRGTILKSSKTILKDNGNIIPLDLKIEWVTSEEKDTFIKNGRVIVRMKQSANPHENLVVATSEYINSGLLPNEREYLDRGIMDASSVLLLRKIIASSGSHSLSYLDNNYITPKFEADNELKETYNDLVRVDKNGMFIGVLLNEYQKAATKIYGEIPDEELIAESREFMRFLHKIAFNAITDVNQLDFNRDHFKVSVFLASRDITLNKHGISGIARKALEQIEQGIETIYIFGLGRKIDVARDIAHELSKDMRINYVQEHFYKHQSIDNKRLRGVFYECSVYMK